MSKIDYNHEVNCSLSVSNVNDALTWYSTVLGFELSERMDQIGFAVLKTPVPGVVLGLSETEDGGGKEGGVTMTWGVTDLEAAQAAIAVHDVRTDGEIREIPGVVRILGFYDPDGNHHQFWAEPKD
jgi:predicted enzyme related to lactoylglutathione lyase